MIIDNGQEAMNQYYFNAMYYVSALFLDTFHFGLARVEHSTHNIPHSKLK